MNIVWNVNGMLRKLRECEWMVKDVNKMWINGKELGEVGNNLVIY